MSSQVFSEGFRKAPSFSAIALLATLVAGLLSTPAAYGANGDLVRVSEVLAGKDLADIALDTADGSFWVLGANGSSTDNHRLYNLDPDLAVLRGTLANPHPMGSIGVDLTTNRGIAYRPLSNTLLVLSSVGPRQEQEPVIREITKTGAETGLVFSIDSPDENASFFGLTYDTFTRHFWTLDKHNERVLRVSAAGQILELFTLPGKTAPYTELRGKGISFDIDDASPRLYVPHGDIFTPGPSKIIELETTGVDRETERFGARTGDEIPLSSVPANDLRGIQTFRTARNQRRIAILADAGRIFVVEHAVSDPRPPTELECTLTLTNQVSLTWKNQGSGAGASYDGGIQVLRNDVPFATISGESVSFLDETPSQGTTTYSVRGAEASGGPFSDTSCPCSVTVGPGGLVDWSPFPGGSIFDVTEDPTTGEVFATDSLSGNIVRLDRDLDLLEIVPAPFPNPGGITFIRSIELGFPAQAFHDVLAVTESSGNRARLVRAADPGGPIIVTLNFRLDGIASPRIGGLTFVESSKQFALIETTTREAYVFNQNGSLVSQCSPPFLIPADLDTGITHDPIQDSFLSGFVDGLVREIFAQGNCSPSGFEFSLEGLGPSFDAPGFAGGMQVSENTLLVAGRSSNALFRVLTFPFSPSFVRGDFDANGDVDVTDAVKTANFLFLQGEPPACADSADTNDDGLLDVSDPVYLLFSLFVAGSPPPPPPFPEAGNDPTFRDNLGCAE